MTDRLARMRWLISVLIASLWLLCGRVAGAEAGAAARVALVRATPEDPGLSEAYLRLAGELRAAGFEVSSTGIALDARPEVALALSAETTSSLAAIGIFDAADGIRQLWIFDARSGNLAVKQIVLGGETGRASEVLAISAVELLLASLVELDIRAQAAPAKPKEPAVRVRPPDARPPLVTPPAPTRRLRFGAELGVSALLTRGLGPAWLPAIRLQWSPLSPLRLRLSGFGLGSHSKLSAPEGSVSATHTAVLAESVLRLLPAHELCPQLTLGLGAQHLSIRGERTSLAQWSAALDLGAELAWSRGTHRLELTLGAHTMFAEPYPSIRFHGVERASAGRPTVLLSATIGGWQ